MKAVILVLFGLFLAQDIINIGIASYASYPPETVWDEDFYGTNYRGLKAKYENLFQVEGLRTQPLPTNHWYTNYFFNQWGGIAWAFPLGVSDGDQGVNVLLPTGYTDGETHTDPHLSIRGTNFHPASSIVQSFTDLGFTFRVQDGNGYFDTTVVHGVPYIYFEFNGVAPVIHPGAAGTFYDAAGQALTFPSQVNVFTVEFDNLIYGIHAPQGVTLTKTGDDITVAFPAGAKTYLVVSALPTRDFLKVYDQTARNKITDSSFTYDYIIAEGVITTTFAFKTTNLDTGAAGGNTLLTFLPHHWRTTTQSFGFIDGATYRSLHGTSKTGAPGLTFTLTYEFEGYPPYLPAPLELTPAQEANLAQLITHNAQNSGGFDGNTYAKGLGEKSTIMLQAHARGTTADADTIRNNLKKQYADWFSYEKSETKQHFFAMYPEYGALIGWPSGYGSQGFNDLHFHYGYFLVGAGRVMLLDDEFKAQYADFAKYLVQDFANYKHYNPNAEKSLENPFFPYFRTFDTYEGHSYAGGTGDGTGNNQESTSEALNSWWGIYVLGIALNDPELIKLGAVGYKLEVTAAGEYWLDLYNENFPDTYHHEYVGIMRSGSLHWGTYFSGDAAWVLGIQGVPCDFYYQPYGNDPDSMRRVWEGMLKDRNNNDAFSNIHDMDPYLGGYHLNLIATYDPNLAIQYLDRLYAEGGGWTQHVNIATDYYVAHAYVTYGRPAKGYHTSLASGAVFLNDAGELTYLIYNPAETTANVQIFKNGVVVDTVAVGAKQYYNSKQK